MKYFSVGYLSFTIVATYPYAGLSTNLSESISPNQYYVSPLLDNQIGQHDLGLFSKSYITNFTLRHFE